MYACRTIPNVRNWKWVIDLNTAEDEMIEITLKLPHRPISIFQFSMFLMCRGASCLRSWFRKKQVSNKEKLKALSFWRGNGSRWPAWHTHQLHISNEKHSSFKLTINIFSLYFCFSSACTCSASAALLHSYSLYHFLFTPETGNTL